MQEKQKHLLWQKDFPKIESSKPQCMDCGCLLSLDCKHKPITDLGCRLLSKNVCACCKEVERATMDDYDAAYKAERELTGQIELF